MAWRKKPTELPIKSKYPFILYIDESGTSSLKAAYDHISKEKPIDELNVNGRYLCLAGVIISYQEHIPLIKQMTFLKNKYWPPRGQVFDIQGFEKKVCLHGSEIMQRKFPFNFDKITHELFKSDIIRIVSTTRFEIIACLLDKYTFAQKYPNPYQGYNYLTECIIEKFYHFLNNRSQTGVIVFESRGREEDFLLHSYIMHLLQNGTPYVTRSELNDKIKGVFFNTKRTLCNSRTYCGLEIADLCIAPMKFALINKNNNNLFFSSHYLFKETSYKILGFPKTLRYGIKILP